MHFRYHKKIAVNITAQPKSQSVRLGEPVTFSVKASGSGLKYQWYFKKKGQTSFSEWKGRIGRTETVIPNSTWDGIQIYCKVTDSKGNSVASDKATVTVKPTIEITAQPKSQSVKLGESVTFSVKASGSGLKYQWYFKKKGQKSFSERRVRNHSANGRDVSDAPRQSPPTPHGTAFRFTARSPTAQAIRSIPPLQR